MPKEVIYFEDAMDRVAEFKKNGMELMKLGIISFFSINYKGAISFPNRPSTFQQELGQEMEILYNMMYKEMGYEI